MSGSSWKQAQVALSAADHQKKQNHNAITSNLTDFFLKVTDAANIEIQKFIPQCHFQVVQTSLMPGSRAIQEYADGITHAIDIVGFDTQAYIFIGRGYLGAAANALLGGMANAGAGHPERKLSHFDRMLAEFFSTIWFGAIKKICSTISIDFDIGLGIRSIELHKAPICREQASSVVSVLCAAEMDQAVSHLSIILSPHMVPSFERRGSRSGSSSSTLVPDEKLKWQEQLEYQVSSAPITVDALLPAQEMSLDMVRNLRVGDVVPLCQNAFEKLELQANGMSIYSGSLGKQGEVLTVRITTS